MSSLYFEINGQPVASRVCSWAAFAPCGCMSGVMLADTTDMRGGEVYATEAQAWAGMWENAEQIRRRQAQGYTLRLIRSDTVRELFKDCTHEPRWGVVKTPVPEGYGWASVRAFRNASRRVHLVKGCDKDGIDQLVPWPEIRDGAPEVTSLCGKKSHHYWATTQWATADLPECRGCQTAARKAVAS